MKFGLVPYFYQITDAQTKEPRQEHVGNDFMAHCIDEMMANHQGKGCLEGTHKKELDVIVDFLSIINAQKGVQASLRRFEIDPADHSIFMCIDIAAKGLNRKIKDMMFWGEEKDDDGYRFKHHGVSVKIGNGHRIDIDSYCNKRLSLSVPDDRAKLLEYVAKRIAAERLKQKFQDRAKGYVQERVKSKLRLRGVKAQHLKGPE